MHVIAVKTLREFAACNPATQGSIEYWIKVAKAARWTSSQAVIAAFPSAKVIDAERVRFEIAHNAFRLVCRINYKSGTIFVVFLGTHREYDKIDAKTVSLY